MTQTNASEPRACPVRELAIRGLASRDAWDHENGFYWFGHPTRIAKLVGFDAFGKFPSAGIAPDDADFVARFEDAGGDGLSVSEAQSILGWKEFRNVELVAGDVFATLPTYLHANPECRIALLHLDMDVEKPTAFALDQLYDRVVPGGLVVIDDYNAVAGATRASDVFFAARGLRPQTTRHYSAPAFVRKPG